MELLIHLSGSRGGLQDPCPGVLAQLLLLLLPQLKVIWEGARLYVEING